LFKYLDEIAIVQSYALLSIVGMHIWCSWISNF